MDKLKRVLSGNDSPNDENRGIMGDVCDKISSIPTNWKKEFIQLNQHLHDSSVLWMKVSEKQIEKLKASIEEAFLNFLHSEYIKIIFFLILLWPISH